LDDVTGFVDGRCGFWAKAMPDKKIPAKQLIKISS
jgi:hypothetical protein